MVFERPGRRLPIGFVVCVSFFSVHPSFAEPPLELHPEIEVLRAFAPILWPATDEPIVPTLPHSFAFDGIDTHHSGQVDLADLDEISWDVTASLEEVGQTLLDFGVKNLQPRVLFYEPRCFRVFNGRHLYVLEYWFYYPFDQGVGGHKGDSEHFFVFVALPKPASDSTWAEFKDAEVVGVVGAGHERHTSNNILVAGSKQQFGRRILPQELAPHMPVIVERGKHGSAADRDFNGRFDLGADSNIFRQGAWGSRDVHTDSAGRLFGRFQGWFSFPRAEREVLLESRFKEPTLYGSYQEWYPDKFPPRNTLDGQQFADVVHGRTYVLFPLIDLRHLYSLLEDNRLTNSELAGKVQEFLQKHRHCFWRDPPESVQVTPDAAEKMRMWPDKKQWNGEAHNVKLLEHRDHQNPNNIFKLHPYPPVALGASYKVDGKTNNLLEASVRIAEVSLFGREFLPDSMLEVNASWDLNRKKWYDAELHYWFFRGGYTGLYAGIAVRKEYLAGAADLDDETLATVRERTGITNLTFTESSDLQTAADFGAALTFSLFRRLIVDAKGGLRTEIFRDRPTDLEIARGAEDKLRFMFSVGLRLGITNPRHPLNH